MPNNINGHSTNATLTYELPTRVHGPSLVVLACGGLVGDARGLNRLNLWLVAKRYQVVD